MLVPILHHDPDYLIVDKPCDCTIDSVHAHLYSQFPQYSKLRNVHQLDYATSGVYCLALTKKAAAAASLLFRARSVRKTYVALLRGHMDGHSYNVSAGISKDPTHPFRMRIDNLSGRPAQTNITVLRRAYFSPSLPVTMVQLEPISGRRHQLRLHTQSLDHPIVGDYNYEQPDYTDTFRMMLHAWKIVLPFSDGLLSIETENPFESLLIDQPAE
ncbi:pseudouridine synthase [Endogone sp. FLAS-F59071]|nr:pseudouridine synthase [Endogone sp. FLAS-F59071]|eukprot:RUS14880.1 pseudouridine synthase [Endogone sp. FLAS-F59071]